MLHETVQARFDELREDGRLFFEETNPENVTDNGYKVQFRLTGVFDKKPVPENNGSSQLAKKEPFLEPEDGFVLEKVGATHLLQFNKFCMYRPHLLLHTVAFRPQTESLDLTDFEAIVKILQELQHPYVAFYNCGEEAGSSQGHKHVQLIPKPEKDDFELFPDTSDMKEALIAGEQPLRPPASLNVPFICYVAPLASDTAGSDVFGTYRRCLELCSLVSDEIRGHNMVMSSDWICVIPRRHRGRMRVPANAMGMMGMSWLGTRTERLGWSILGIASHLSYIGIPVSGCP